MRRSGHSFITNLAIALIQPSTSIHLSAADNRVNGPASAAFERRPGGSYRFPEEVETSLAAVSAAHLTHDPQSSDMALRAPPIITAMTQAPLVWRRTGDVCLLPELWSFYTPPNTTGS